MAGKTPFEKTLGDALSIGLEVIAVCGNIACRYVVEVDLHRIVRHLGLDHPLLPRRGERHYSELLKCSECKHKGAYIWLGEATKLRPADEELVHRVDRWSEDEHHNLEVMARARNIKVARAAFDEAVRVYPEAIITLRQGAVSIAESPRLAARTEAREKVRQLRPTVKDDGHYGGKRRRQFGRR